MAASLQDIKGWFESAEQRGATHMIVMTDTFDWDDYPVYCSSVEEALEKAANPGEMQKVMEVYKISLGWLAQVGGRVSNF